MALVRTLLETLAVALKDSVLNQETFRLERQYAMLADGLQLAGLCAPPYDIDVCRSLLKFATEPLAPTTSANASSFVMTVPPTSTAMATTTTTAIATTTTAATTDSAVSTVALTIVHPRALLAALSLMPVTSPPARAAFFGALVPLVRSEANAQALAAVGFAETLLGLLRGALLDPADPLHASISTLVLCLGAQHLSPAELRLYLRLALARGSAARPGGAACHGIGTPNPAVH